MKKQKPWLDENDQPLDDRKLKEVSASWTEEIWNDYLISLEHTEDESLIQSGLHQIEHKVCEDFRSLITDPAPLNNKLVKKLNTLVDELPERRQKVLRESYWAEKTERLQAFEENVSRGVIYRQKKKAKAQIKELLLKKPNHLNKWKDSK